MQRSYFPRRLGKTNAILETGGRKMSMTRSPLGLAWACMIAAVMLLTPLTATASAVVASVPGNTVVQDPADALAICPHPFLG